MSACGMVTTDAEKYREGVLMIGSKKRDAVLVIGEMQSRRREMASCNIWLRSRQRNIVAHFGHSWLAVGLDQICEESYTL